MSLNNVAEPFQARRRFEARLLSAQRRGWKASATFVARARLVFVVLEPRHVVPDCALKRPLRLPAKVLLDARDVEVGVGA
jgi:hypothetical protein